MLFGEKLKDENQTGQLQFRTLPELGVAQRLIAPFRIIQQEAMEVVPIILL
jgi:hypothetical protein